MLDHSSLEFEALDSDSGQIEILRQKIRHSAAHVMADAVMQLFPDAKIGIGPPTKDGFYYDFEVTHPFTPDDLEKIEKRCNKTRQTWLTVFTKRNYAAILVKTSIVVKVKTVTLPMETRN